MPRKNAKSQKNPPKKRTAKAVKKRALAPKKRVKKLKFEDCIQEIDVEISKRKN